MLSLDEVVKLKNVNSNSSTSMGSSEAIPSSGTPVTSLESPIALQKVKSNVKCPQTSLKWLTVAMPLLETREISERIERD